jgi:hypothetical protein
MRRRLAMAGSGMLAILALTGGSALAAVDPATLDQQQLDTSANGAYWGSVYTLAQTFTPAASGTLTAVSLNVGVNTPDAVNVVPAVAGDATVGIYATSTGIPTGSALATGTIAAGGIPGWYDLEFASPPTVAAGTLYAIVAKVGVGDYINWTGHCDGDVYTRGEALILDITDDSIWETILAWAAANEGGSNACEEDFAFRTYVTVPQATAQPTVAVTPPPTGTGMVPESRTDSAPLLVAAGLALAAAFVTIRRYGFVRR